MVWSRRHIGQRDAARRASMSRGSAHRWRQASPTVERLARLSAQVTPPAPERDALNEEGSDRARAEKKAGAEPATEYYDRRAVAEVDHPCAEEPEDNGQGAVGH